MNSSNLTMPTGGGGKLEALLLFIVNKFKGSMYEIGDIYMTLNPNMNTVEKVSNRFGGTWEKLEDVFLLASGSKTTGTTGGEATHKLTISETPSHTHSFSGYTNTTGAHYHQMADREIYSAGGSYYACVSSNYSSPSGWSNSTTIGDHNHSISGTTGAIGGNAYHNNMPPYLVINMFKRIG